MKIHSKIRYKIHYVFPIILINLFLTIIMKKKIEQIY